MSIRKRMVAVVREYDESCAALLACLSVSETPGGIYAARLRFNKAGNRRSTMLRTEIVPLMRSLGTPEGNGLAQAIIDRLGRFNDIYLAHIERWGLEQVEANWEGYRLRSIALIESCRLSTPAEDARIDAVLRSLERDATPSG